MSQIQYCVSSDLTLVLQEYCLLSQWPSFMSCYWLTNAGNLQICVYHLASDYNDLEFYHNGLESYPTSFHINLVNLDTSIDSYQTYPDYYETSLDNFHTYQTYHFNYDLTPYEWETLLELLSRKSQGKIAHLLS